MGDQAAVSVSSDGASIADDPEIKTFFWALVLSIGWDPVKYGPMNVFEMGNHKISRHCTEYSTNGYDVKLQINPAKDRNSFGLHTENASVNLHASFKTRPGEVGYMYEQFLSVMGPALGRIDALYVLCTHDLRHAIIYTHRGILYVSSRFCTGGQSSDASVAIKSCWLHSHYDARIIVYGQLYLENDTKWIAKFNQKTKKCVHINLDLKDAKQIFVYNQYPEKTCSCESLHISMAHGNDDLTLAFAMGLHARLGGKSLVRNLDDAVAATICSYFRSITGFCGYCSVRDALRAIQAGNN